jgi:hypothetical protein
MAMRVLFSHLDGNNLELVESDTDPLRSPRFGRNSVFSCGFVILDLVLVHEVQSGPVCTGSVGE